TLLIDFVQCGIASTSVRTAHTTAAGALMSTDVWTFLNPGAPPSAHDFANLDHPCEGRRQTRRYDLTYQCDQASRLRNGQRTPGGGLITRAAELARSHSDTNVLCIGAKIIGSAIALEIVRVWMAT